MVSLKIWVFLGMLWMWSRLSRERFCISHDTNSVYETMFELRRLSILMLRDCYLLVGVFTISIFSNSKRLSIQWHYSIVVWLIGMKSDVMIFLGNLGLNKETFPLRFSMNFGCFIKKYSCKVSSYFIGSSVL